MTHYSSPRQTVRDALGLLRDEGLIDRLQGTGTFVVIRREAMPLLEAQGVNGNLHRLVVRELRREVVPLPPPVARKLEQEPGAPGLLVDYLIFGEGQPWSLGTNYVRFPQAEALRDIPLHWHWYELLERAGLTIGSSSFLIEAMVADESVAMHLECSPGSPVLAFEQVIRDEEGIPFDVAFGRSRGDRFALFSEASRGSGFGARLP